MEIDGYLSCDAYAGHSDSPESGFTTFTAADGENYFAMLAKDGSVLLRSEGYPTTAARDNGLQSVLKNREIKERYKVIEEGGEWFLILKAGNHQEIARSCPFKSESEIYDTFTFLKEGSSADFTWNIAPVAVAAAGAAAISGDKEDDYLVCGEYKERIADSASAKYPGYITFLHENGKYYFGKLNAEGELELRSEGYTSEAGRDNGIESVQKNYEIAERFSSIESHGFKIKILKAGNHQEIARSCPYKETGAASIAGVAAAAGAAALAGTAVEKESSNTGAIAAAAATAGAAAILGSTDSDKAASPEKSSSNTGAIAAAAATAGAAALAGSKSDDIKAAAGNAKAAASKVTETASTYVEEEAAAGGSNWWKWLLGAAILAGIALWLMKGCKKSEVAAPAVESVQVDTTTVDTTAAPAAISAATCNCSGNSESIFNKPAGATPKKLPRLGTNPEFARYGDLHSMNAASFLAFLNERSGASTVDNAFLDRITKAMGYANGLADLKEGAISETTFDNGTYGNLGWGAAHNTGYDELPDNEKDRKAFKIAGNGGCDIYFMKTCGNHFVPFNNCQ